MRVLGRLGARHRSPVMPRIDRLCGSGPRHIGCDCTVRTDRRTDGAGPCWTGGLAFVAPRRYPGKQWIGQVIRRCCDPRISTQRTVAVVGQDVLRRDVLGTGDDVDGHATGLIDLTSRYALNRGFDVIVEGILNAEWYSETLLRLVDDHRGTSRCYLYDLPFDETVRRHTGKPVADAFGEAEMRAWWRGCQPVEGLHEAIVTKPTASMRP